MLARRAFPAPWRLHNHYCPRLKQSSPLLSSLKSLFGPNGMTKLLTTTPALRKSTNLPHLPNLRPDVPHTDLPSFIAHAIRTNLDPESKVYVGTHYEYTVQTFLTTTHHFQLTRIAGANDRGIDLLGYWHLPHFSQPLPVIIQCKVLLRLQPRVVRELEGSFPGAPKGWDDERKTLACLVGTGSATKGIREAIGGSRVGIVWMNVTREGVVKQMLWNERAREMALEGLDVVVSHAKERKQEELRLMFDGKLIPKGAAKGRKVLKEDSEDTAERDG